MCTSELAVPLDVMFERGVQLVTIHLRDRYVFFDNGCTLPITEMFDKDGETVHEWEHAVACEFGNEQVGYGTVMMPVDERSTFH